MKNAPNNISSEQVAYIHGRIEAEIEGFAKSLDIPCGQLAYRVAALLLSKTSGEVLGIENRMSSMPRKTSYRSKTVAEVEMASGSHGKSHIKKKRVGRPGPRSKKEKAEMSRRMKAFWASRKAG